MKTKNRASETFSGIKNLRTKSVQKRPLFVRMLASIEGTVAFLGRMVVCDNSLLIQTAPKTEALTKSGRFVTNDHGKWVPVKD